MLIIIFSHTRIDSRNNLSTQDVQKDQSKSFLVERLIKKRRCYGVEFVQTSGIEDSSFNI